MKTWKIKSSNEEKTYTVSMITEYHWECTCPHYVHRKTHCKHIKVTIRAYEKKNKPVKPSDHKDINVPTKPVTAPKTPKLDPVKVEDDKKKLQQKKQDEWELRLTPFSADLHKILDNLRELYKKETDKEKRKTIALRSGPIKTAIRNMNKKVKQDKPTLDADDGRVDEVMSELS